MSPGPPHVLLVEDDQVDCMGIKRAFSKASLGLPIHVARDGVEALERLRGEGGYGAVPRPRLILLDLNMPRMNGIEFLRTLRQDTELRRSVVFVLTTSNAVEDRNAAYDLNVAGYLLKSRLRGDYSSLSLMLRYYLELAELP